MREKDFLLSQFLEKKCDLVHLKMGHIFLAMIKIEKLSLNRTSGLIHIGHFDIT